MLYSEKEESGTTERRYILGNEYLGHEDSGQDVTFAGENQKREYSYITDEQGSIRYILNTDRQIETYQEYSAFGERIWQEGASGRLGYNSQTGDELTGLTYLRARYYNPATGRFTQEDVIYDDGFNLYAYCDSNPVIYCDPSGFAGINQDACKHKMGGESTSESRELKEVFNSIKDSPNYPESFKTRINGTTSNKVNNHQLLEKLRKIESGTWNKVYKDGYDSFGNKISIHYFRSQSGKVFNVKVKQGWSN